MVVSRLDALDGQSEFSTCSGYYSPFSRRYDPTKIPHNGEGVRITIREYDSGEIKEEVFHIRRSSEAYRDLRKYPMYFSLCPECLDRQGFDIKELSFEG